MAIAADRVESQTAASINKKIDDETINTIAYYVENPTEIEARLRELQSEWDIERTLQANAATLAFLGTVLGTLFARRFLVLPVAVSAFLFQHATQGWCPPLPVLRRLGFRTAREIAREYYALKAVRGDFDKVKEAANKTQAASRAVGLRRTVSRKAEQDT